MLMRTPEWLTSDEMLLAASCGFVIPAKPMLEFRTLGSRRLLHLLPLLKAALEPSAKPLDRLEKSIHRYAFSPETSDSDESAIVDAAASLNNSAAAITAVAHRTLPTLLVVLLLVVGSMIAAITGISFADMSRPILLPIWSLIPALSIAVIPGPADIGLDLEPLRAIAEALSTKL